MMNSNSTHKIVVGIGLAVVFGVGVSVFAVRAKEASDLARNAPAPALAAPADQNATDTAAPAASPAVPSSTDQTAPVSGAAPSVPAAAPPPDAHSGQTSDELSPAAKSDREDRRAAKTRNSGDFARSRVGSAASVKTSPLQASAASTSDPTSSSPAGATAEAQPSVAPAEQETAMNAGVAASSSSAPAQDSQITATVKSEVATAAPISDLNVTTTNGVVALAGSVPSEDAVDQAKQAALRVAGVKQVDASGLTVSDR
jgi:hyperosmotically inducible periplasmic protein